MATYHIMDCLCEPEHFRLMHHLIPENLAAHIANHSVHEFTAESEDEVVDYLREWLMIDGDRSVLAVSTDSVAYITRDDDDNDQEFVRYLGE